MGIMAAIIHADLGSRTRGPLRIVEQLRLPDEDEQSERHPDAGGGEPIMPAGRGIEPSRRQPCLEPSALRQIARHEGCEERTDVDPHVEDREAGIAPLIIALIEAADERRDARLEQARAQRHQHEPGVERGSRMQGQREMPERDDHATKQNGPRGTKPSICNEPAGDGEHVDRHRVIAVDDRRLRGRKPEPALFRRRHHEQHEQRPHAVVGKPLPHFGEEQRPQTARLTHAPRRYRIPQRRPIRHATSSFIKGR